VCDREGDEAGSAGPKIRGGEGKDFGSTFPEVGRGKEKRGETFASSFCEGKKRATPAGRVIF